MKGLILGISTSHNCTAALLDFDGNIIGVVSEERFTRQKNETGFPSNAVKFLAGLVVAGDIKHIVIGEDIVLDKFYNSPRTLLNISQRTRFFRNPLNMILNFLGSYLTLNIWKKFDIKEEIKKRLWAYGIIGELHFVEHHFSHGAGAYFSENLENCLTITMDGQGNNKSSSTFTVVDNKMEEVYYLSKYDSAGNLYAFVTTILGFKQNRHEGKITGLAAYGDPQKAYGKLSGLLRVEELNGNLKFASPLLTKAETLTKKVMHKVLFEYLKWLLSGKSIESFIYKLVDIYNFAEKDEILPDLNEKREDIAAAVQFILEDRVCKFAEFYLKKYKLKNLILAGGVFANVKLNQRIFNLPGVENIFVHPGMGDEGLALGGAYYHLSKINPKFKRKPLKDVYLGPSYSDEEIEKALKKYKIKYSKIEDEAVIAKKTAKLIAEGKIIGFFRGRMEYGPRALGARSVLADPRKKEMHDILNERMKRSEFMPFAPVIPYERMNDILGGKIKGSEHTAEFMTITYDVKKEWQEKIPAVVHVDGTARPQLIKREINSLYYDIVTEFGKITGVPVIINTSFNMHEEPIVCTPEDAIRSYLQGCVDVMVMERFVVGMK
ncbi:MAG: carbamoyltransferase C-terminal domain-containing protein [Candidatus Omnitrophota bacterium]